MEWRRVKRQLWLVIAVTVLVALVYLAALLGHQGL
jgi:hypothetical protein